MAKRSKSEIMAGVESVSSKIIDNNTVEYYRENGDRVIRLHLTDVVTFKSNGDIILDSGERGEVVEVGIRSTRIKTRDDVIVTIPNSIMANSKIINESAPEPRFRIVSLWGWPMAVILKK